MAFCRLVFPLLVLSVVSCYASVPVFSWGDLEKTSVKANPLVNLGEKDFSLFLKHELVEQPLTVVFLEKTLSVEDFSTRNSDGKTPFEYLQGNLQNSVYLPSVENAVPALEGFAGKERSDVITLTPDALSEEISHSSGAGRFLFIKLEDAGESESRADLLRRHDQFMQKVITKLQNDQERVVAIYTAENPSWTVPVLSRSRRAAQNFDGIHGLRMTTKNITLRTDNTTVALSDWQGSSNFVNDTTQTNSLKFGDTNITLSFNSKGGYWFFESVTIEQPSVSEVFQPVEEVFAILGFSYRCLQYVSFSNDNRSKTLSFEDLKIQPFFINNDTVPAFGDPFNCVGFFTAPIWSGLFVVFILLLITFYGIMMMMDIRTMDRFDDPKGKTITINTGE